MHLIAALALLLFIAESAFATPPGPVIYANEFSPGEIPPPVHAGAWNVVNDEWRSSARGPNDFAMVIEPGGDCCGRFVDNFTVHLSTRQTSTSGSVGVIYNYVDGDNYYEFTLAATGAAKIIRVLSGTSSTVATASRPAIPTNQWFRVALVRNGGITTVIVDGTTVFPGVMQSEFPTRGSSDPGGIGMATHLASAAFDSVSVVNDWSSQPYVENFSDGAAQGWSGNGSWNIGNGILTSSAIGPADVYLAPIMTYERYQNEGFSSVFRIPYAFRVRIQNLWGARGNVPGVVFDYVDANNYSEATFSPTGVASFKQVTAGVQRTLATTTYSGGARGSWFVAEVRHITNFETDGEIEVRVNGVRLFDPIPLVNSYNPVGVITHWTQANFDDFEAQDSIPSAFTENFTVPPTSGGPWFRNAGWEGVAGTYRNSNSVYSDHEILQRGSGARYTYRARVLNRWGNSGNRVGLIYDYQPSFSSYGVPAGGPGDRHEVLFAPTGTAYLYRVLHGVRMQVASAPYSGGGKGVWFNVEIVRDRTHTTVKVNDTTVFNRVQQAEFAGGWPGLIASWSYGQFDDLSLTPVP
jgi:hypothetical protein